METESQGTQPNGVVNGVAHEEPGQVTKPQMRLSYDDYKTMADMIVVHMQTEEARLGEGKLS